MTDNSQDPEASIPPTDAQPTEPQPAAPEPPDSQPTEPQSSGTQSSESQPTAVQPDAEFADAQPTESQPTAVQPDAESADAQPTEPQLATAPTAGYPAEGPQDTLPQQAATGATTPIDGRVGETEFTPAAPAKKSNAIGIVAALVVGALVGGVSGAGISAWVVSANKSDQASTVTTPQNITVNDTDHVNVVSAVAAKAEPSVVTISVSGTSAAGTGSGVILSEDGYVLTNTHVVTLDGEISNPTVQVTLADGRLFSAEVVGTDPIVDLAVIKLKGASGLTPAEFGDSSKLNVGETAIAIGAPLGLSNTVTDGIVSALNRSITVASSAAPDSQDDSGQQQQNGQNGPFDFWNFDNGQGSQQQQQQTTSSTISLPVIQTDAAINPGNSGGALLDSTGKVIGVNVAIASAGSSSSSSSSGSIGVGFAIPSNLAQRVANEIIKDGSATHGLLGASVVDVSDSDKSATVGAVVKELSSGGAAEKAGLRVGDVITAFNGVAISGSTDLTAQVRYQPGGGKASLTYTRDGKSATVDVTLGTLKQ